MLREVRERAVELTVEDLRRIAEDQEVIDFLECIVNEIYEDVEDRNYESEYEDSCEEEYSEESELDRLSEALEHLNFNNTITNPNAANGRSRLHRERCADDSNDLIVLLKEVFGPDVEVGLIRVGRPEGEQEDELEDPEETNELTEIEERLRSLK